MNTEQERADFEAWAADKWPGANFSPDQNNCGIVVPERYKHPKLQAAWEAYQAGRAALQSQDREDAEQARKDGFSDGVILALQVMTCHGDYGSTAYCELLRAAGMSEIIERAVAEGMWEISGLDRTSDAVAARAAKGDV